MIDQVFLDAFQTMWGPFPEPVMLVHKNRTILAVNDLGRTIGIPAGTKCFTLNPEGPTSGVCKHCKANLALRSGQTICEEGFGTEDNPIRGYWMPLKEAPEVYVHFGIGTYEVLKGQLNSKQETLPVLSN